MSFPLSLNLHLVLSSPPPSPPFASSPSVTPTISGHLHFITTPSNNATPHHSAPLSTPNHRHHHSVGPAKAC
ncbi:hypothetical protein E2C01_092174 [Portunus trituberculatus]|uniref:Uncharacterized protein n=1 Tax=Portunus trituberculatus TaxID=210409 RepID=A0A5B7JX25_PORTR|nr:hypothetical protein [Portunus trituberculatus]